MTIQPRLDDAAPAAGPARKRSAKREPKAQRGKASRATKASKASGVAPDDITGAHPHPHDLIGSDRVVAAKAKGTRQ